MRIAAHHHVFCCELMEANAGLSLAKGNVSLASNSYLSSFQNHSFIRSSPWISPFCINFLKLPKFQKKKKETCFCSFSANRNFLLPKTALVKFKPALLYEHFSEPEYLNWAEVTSNFTVPLHLLHSLFALSFFLPAAYLPLFVCHLLPFYLSPLCDSLSLLSPPLFFPPFFPPAFISSQRSPSNCSKNDSHIKGEALTLLA